ncbi:MAG: hypothetical protein IJT41_07260 [Clostridia bacterium]|nr:hypothetical protein [Clostridia bacterium]
MQYPMAATTLLYRKQPDGKYRVKDVYTGNSCTMTLSLVRLLRRLDGKTDPYSVPTDLTQEDIDTSLQDLAEIGFLRTSRVFEKFIGTFIYTLWIPKMTKKLRIAARYYDRILKCIWLPVLALGVWLFFCKKDDMFDGYSTLGFITGWIAAMTAGIFLHELSHAMAAVACGVRVFEGGVLIECFMPGAYVMLDEEHIRCPRDKVHIYAAGIQMNYLLTGLGLVITGTFGSLGGFWITFSMINLLLAAPNALFIYGLDGYKILVNLLGKKDEGLFPLLPRSTARKTDRRTRAVSMTANIMILIWQIALPIILICNVAVFFQ